MLPDAGQIEVVDVLTPPAGSAASLDFSLAASFTPLAEGASIERLDDDSRARFRHYRLTPKTGGRALTLRYSGRIDPGPAHAEHGMPRAALDADGVFLDGASGWYPRFGEQPMRFSLAVEAPAGWSVISQGRRDSATHWTATAPQDDIYLLAGPYRRHAAAHGAVELEVYLRNDDAALAGRYLGVMGQYLDLYSTLIGDYPYPKFAVVENRWPTGYGMPSFTLLGAQVMRLPFILYSSLPHEILHNWWGNGVWVDARDGNWSEGLTAYLADHLIQEARGQGAEYRRKQLERYAAFATEGRDMPLRDFVSRHSEASQAVGYGKALMLFHMLRRQMGDPAFVSALRTLWQQHRFTTASFDTVRRVFTTTASAGTLAERWFDQPGAPAIKITQLRVSAGPNGHHVLHLILRQTQPGPAYPLRVPVAVQVAGSATVHRFELVFTGREARLRQSFATAPTRVDVDPDYDIFRLLDPAERPASLARLFGARTQWLVLPSAASADVRAAWQRLAGGWAQRFDNIKVVRDDTLDALPADGAIWLLGWDNRWRKTTAARLDGAGQSITGDDVRIADQTYPRSEHTAVLLDTDTARAPLGWIGADTPADIATLARKLPHYGSAGRLMFARGSGTNVRQDALLVSRSPLRRVLGTIDPGPPPAHGSMLIDVTGMRLDAD
ncbi:M1 family metallopeptidase [Denitromonas ohlonensis]|uniref:M1 family metallopeptidase n=2 Tax=Denitromonas TaxID=139331 RepID=A0A557SQS0_9RHOO|nr:M1 family aminopeptidase [Denitromonas ohlonensis]TVO66887.1 M1 family metallopeptidase [Denitromonas ohlonensis]TVO79757.1 M1 family metallopeptidase [Denitromonas ohlonensis]